MDKRNLFLDQFLRQSSLQSSYLATQLLQKFFPRYVAFLSAYIWFTPVRKRPSKHFVRLSEASTTTLLQTRKYPILLRTWGKQSTQQHFVLVHGWAGRWDQFSVLIDYLVEAGHRVSVVDFPAHGESPGMSTDLREWFEVLNLAQNSKSFSEPIYVCHSFGLAAVSHAVLQMGLKAKAIVAINSPTRLQYILDQFVRMTRLDARVVPHLLEKVSKRTQGAEQTVTIDIKKLSEKVPLLFIADQDDKHVDFSEHGPLQKILGERFIRTEGLGHNRILESAILQKCISEFVRSLDVAFPIPPLREQRH